MQSATLLRMAKSDIYVKRERLVSVRTAGEE
jgi:hypothetical protein